MSMTLERSESVDTYSTVAPVPVMSKQMFANFIVGKLVKRVTWDNNNNNWMAVDFADQSRLIVSDGEHGPDLIYVGPPAHKK